MDIDHSSEALLIIVMGVSGSGKTTLAKELAQVYGFEFVEADDYHSVDARRHMAAGNPLSDEMREPWIRRMLDALVEKHKENKSCILAYSGLKLEHRQRFRSLPYSPNIIFLLLDGSYEFILKRMEARTEHFMPSTLLASQFAALEIPNSEPGSAFGNQLNKETDVRLVNIETNYAKVFSKAKEIVDCYLSKN